MRWLKKRLLEKESNKQSSLLIEYKKKLEQPVAMNYKQTAKYLSTSFNTLKKLINMGLIKVVLVDGYERISKEEADRFLRENAK